MYSLNHQKCHMHFYFMAKVLHKFNSVTLHRGGIYQFSNWSIDLSRQKTHVGGAVWVKTVVVVLGCLAICLILSLLYVKVISHKSHLWGRYFSCTTLMWFCRPVLRNEKYLHKWHSYLVDLACTASSCIFNLFGSKQEKSHLSHLNFLAKVSCIRPTWPFKVLLEAKTLMQGSID